MTPLRRALDPHRHARRRGRRPADGVRRTPATCSRSSARRCRSSATRRSPTCARRRCASPASPGVDARRSRTLIVYGHRVLPPNCATSCRPIDKSWGAYGVQEEGRRRRPGHPTDARQTPTTPAGTRQAAFAQAGVSPRTQRRDRPNRCCTTIHVAPLPHRPWTLLRSDAAPLRSPLPEPKSRPRPRLRLRRLRPSAAQHAGRRRRHC